MLKLSCDSVTLCEKKEDTERKIIKVTKQTTPGKVQLKNEIVKTSVGVIYNSAHV